MKRANIISTLLFIVFILAFYNCSNDNSRGFSLQQFDVKNIQLDSIICSFMNNNNEEIKDLSNKVPILALHHIDSFPAFNFTFVEKEDVSPYCIFEENRRIVGYVEIKNKDVIVLTKTNSKLYFAMEFYKFLIPTNHTKKFDFIYFPDDMYCVPDENGIPCPPHSFEPNYKVYIYKNNKLELYSTCSH